MRLTFRLTTSIVLMILLLAASSCRQHHKKQHSKVVASNSAKNEGSTRSYESLKGATVAANPDSTECFTVSKQMALIVNPDSSWAAQQMNEYGEESWNEVVADHDYYQSEAIQALEKAGVEVKFVNRERRYIKFIGTGQKATLLDLHKMRDKWGLILFSPGKKPVYWNSTSIDDALKDIFGK